MAATSLLGKPSRSQEISSAFGGGLATIARGDASHVTEPRRTIARGGVARAVGPPCRTRAAPPAVDLSVHTVAAAFAGEKPSAGYSIDVIEEVTEADRARGITLAVEERGPGRGTVAAAILTSPFHIVAVPRTAGEVAWSGSRLAPPASTSSTGLEPRTAAALAYLAGPFSGALMLMAESANADVRFHAWQSLIGLGGLGLAVLASYVLAFVAMFVWTPGVLLMISVAYVIWIVLALVWAICLWKAWSGGRWKLPLVRRLRRAAFWSSHGLHGSRSQKSSV